MKHTMLFSLALFAVSASVAFASGVAPTGCAVVFERANDTTLIATGYEFDSDPDSFYDLSAVDCAATLANFKVQIGDQVMLESYEREYLADIALGALVAIPVDQTWSTPAPGSGSSSGSYMLSYVRAWEWTALDPENAPEENVVAQEGVVDDTEKVQDEDNAQTEKRTLQMKLISVLQQLVSLLGL
jgi:hypothetical protein